MIKSKQGFSLIEVLISMLILFLLLLGLDAVQLKSLQTASATYSFQLASQQIHNLIARINMIKPDEIVSHVRAWNEENAELLPEGWGVLLGTYPHYQVQIFWGDQKEKVCKENKIGKSGCLHLQFSVLENTSGILSQSF